MRSDVLKHKMHHINGRLDASPRLRLDGEIMSHVAHSNRVQMFQYLRIIPKSRFISIWKPIKIAYMDLVAQLVYEWQKKISRKG